MSKQEKFIRLIQDNHRVINKVLYLYTDTSEERKDLKQEILSQAWSAYKRFNNESSFTTWLYRVALNISMTHLKKKKASTTNEFTAQEIQINQDHSHELLELMVKQLNDIEKSIVLLLADGYPRNEIISILGMTDGNLRTKIHRIRTKLKNYGIEEFIR